MSTGLAPATGSVSIAIPDELRTAPPAIGSTVIRYASGAMRPAISNAVTGPAASSS
ncbi:hypothetical protein GGR49_002855 [Sphingomonas carotinifaciens]|nr:hypothetical protein [Sphingomonas carotinifaciens]